MVYKKIKRHNRSWSCYHCTANDAERGPNTFIPSTCSNLQMKWNVHKWRRWFQAHFFESKFVYGILIKIPLNFVFRDLIDNKPKLALVMALNRWYAATLTNRPVSQIRAPPGGLSRTSGKLWQDYSNCYMFWTSNAISFNPCSIYPHCGILAHQ